MSTKSAALFGTLATLRFEISLDDDERDEGFLYRYAAERRTFLRRVIREAVSEVLGPGYEVSNIAFAPGSVTITAVLSVAGTIYVTISQYDDFVKGLGRLTEILRNILGRFFANSAPAAPGIDIVVAGGWQPHPTMLEVSHSLNAAGSDLNHSMVLYLILSNAALLGTFLWLLLRHLN